MGRHPSKGPGRGGPASGIPAGGHDRRHPDFAPGNLVAAKHGAFSPRLVGPMAEEIERGLDRLVEGTPAAAPAFAAARGTLALRLARLARVTAYIEETHGGLPLDEDGQPLPAARLEAELATAVDRALDALGLTPTAAARLGVDLARGSSIAAEVEAALAARERADRRMSPEDPA